jgi:acyl-CoA synthetase (AMP-forming)/AMP-acid ligase II
MTSSSFSLATNGLVWDHWRRHAEATPDRDAIIHWCAGEAPYRWTWGALMASASQVATKLQSRGIKPGQVCALIIRHNSFFYPTYMAVSALGALPSILAYPNPRLHPDKFRQGLQGMSLRSGLDYILTERDLDPIVRPLATTEGSTIRDVLFPLEWYEPPLLQNGTIIDHSPAATTDPVLLQHSSGTTGLQKPVVLSHQAVLEHVKRYAEAIALGPADKIVSWLPLYHDMGLIAAFYLPLTLGVPLVQLDPFEWVSAPVLLLEAVTRERGTLSWLPNFAYNFMSDRIHDDDLASVNLETLRMVINCSEPVRADSHKKFHRRFASRGLRREALAACYAMAETTYAVTQTRPGQEARVLPVSRGELAKGNVVIATGTEDTRWCVSSGAVISGCQVRVVEEHRHEVPSGRVGEIAISSVSLFDGYRNYPEKTAEVLADGWYYSGDYGFMHEGECYVIGRKKDVVIVAGNNVYPEDVEDVVGGVDGVVPGRVIAFGADDEASGTEVLCVVAETDAEIEADRKAVRLAVLKAGMQMDVTIARVYLVPRRWLIKSSAGKPSRSANKTRALTELSWKT